MSAFFTKLPFLLFTFAFPIGAAQDLYLCCNSQDITTRWQRCPQSHTDTDRHTHTHSLSLSEPYRDTHTHTHTHTHTARWQRCHQSHTETQTHTHTHSEPYRDTHTHTHTAFFLFWECHEHAQTWGLLIAWTPRCLPHGSSFLNIGSRCKAGKGQGPCSRGGST